MSNGQRSKLELTSFRGAVTCRVVVACQVVAYLVEGTACRGVKGHEAWGAFPFLEAGRASPQAAVASLESQVGEASGPERLRRDQGVERMREVERVQVVGHRRAKPRDEEVPC